jgi:hypothetical protein
MNYNNIKNLKKGDRAKKKKKNKMKSKRGRKRKSNSVVTNVL